MYNIKWDNKNNGVILTTQKSDIKTPPRPVFYEELDFLGLNKYWDYPKYEEPLMWAFRRAYFYNGRLIFKANGGNIYDEPKLAFFNTTKLNLKPTNINALYENNKILLNSLENEAIEFIRNIYINYKDYSFFKKLAEKQSEKTNIKHSVVIEDCGSFDIVPLDNDKKSIQNIDFLITAFSGGKDSQVVLDLVSRVIPPDDFLVIYSDTGYEIPDSLKIYEQTQNFYKNQYPDLKFYVSKNHQDVLYYWDKMGSPSNIHRWCCSVMKTAPIYRLMKEINGGEKQPYVITFVGLRREESLARANYTKIGVESKHANVISASPVLFWNATEIYLYLLTHNLPINLAYRYGLTRVGCIICPFGSNWSDNICVKKYHEKIKPFEDKIKEIVARRGVKDVENFIKQGHWKLRVGGRNIDCKSGLDISTSPNFKAVLTNFQENIFTWLKVLGKVNYIEQGEAGTGEIKYKGDIFSFRTTKENNNLVFEYENVGKNISFISRLKKVLNKTTYCVHCEACEVECPTGALSVVPIVTVDEKKCIHCYKCLDFNEKGCVLAQSVKTTKKYK